MKRNRTLLACLTAILLFCGYAPMIGQIPAATPLRPELFRESVWLQAERTFYISGETLPFRLNLLETETYQPSVLSRNVRVELLDSGGNRILRQNIGLEGSYASGSFRLDPSLSSGWYYLRAYTNWMRNFPAEEYALLAIKVVNPYQLAEFAAREAVPGNIPSPDSTGSIGLKEENGYIRVTCRNRTAERTGGITLLVHRYQTLYWKQQAVASADLSFAVPAGILPTGIVQFTLVAGDQEILGSRLWSDYKPMDSKIEVTLDKPQAGLREQVEVRYRLPSNSKTDSLLRLSISATQEFGSPGIEETLPGLPGWPATGGIPAGVTDFRNWLAHTSYPEACIRELVKPGSTLHAIDFMPETRSGLIEGTVINQSTRQPVQEATLGLTSLADNRFLATRTGPDGRYHFAFTGVSSPREYIIAFISPPDSAWKIEPDGEFDDRPFKPEVREFSLTQEELKQAENLRINRQLEQIYGQIDSPAVKPAEAVGPGPEFYEPPERLVLTDDYIELANVREVVYEVVPDVSVTGSGHKTRLQVFSSKSYTDAYETLILLDGIPLTDQQSLLELPPTRIRAIEVKNRMYIHGNCLFSAVVNFLSRNGDFAGLSLPVQAVQGIYDPPVFPLPAPKENISPEDPITPRLQPSLLRIGQSLPASGNLILRTNDLQGRFRIRLSGYDSRGKWFSGEQELRVNGVSR